MRLRMPQMTERRPPNDRDEEDSGIRMGRKGGKVIDPLEPICSRCPLEEVCKRFYETIREMQVIEDVSRTDLCPLYWAYINALADYIGTEEAFHIQSEVMRIVEER